MRIGWAIVLVAGCYMGQFREVGGPFTGKRIATECLDLAVTQTDDPRATGPVIAYHFGNRCFHEIHVDLSSIRAIGRYRDGAHPMVAFDPKRELRSLQLDAVSDGHEEIEYLAADGSTPAAICVDVGRVEPSATPTAHWLCFGTWDLGPDADLERDATPIGASDTTDTGWPLPASIDPEVTAMPARALLSVASVGGYLASRIPDKLHLVKALHDFVVRWLVYDNDAKAAIEREDWSAVPSQEADDVFASGRGVCAGYAKLLAALGAAAGVEIQYVTGTASSDTGAGSSEKHAHAWNAARIRGRWLLIDATWDDSDDHAMSTQYLFMPAGTFGVSHVPDDPAWQLVPPPMTFDELVAQPWTGGSR